MKKVAILTLPLDNYNYGGILQAFALQTFLKNHFQVEVQHIDRQYNMSWQLRLKTALYQLTHHRNIVTKKSYYQPIIQFLTQQMMVSKPLNTAQKFHRYLKKNNIEVLITGSDQVWRKQYALNLTGDFFLNIQTPCTKISYAASFGHEDYIDPHIREKLQSLHGISVREKDASDYLNSKGIAAVLHADPTLLLDRSIYDALADKSEKIYTRQITVYLLDKSNEVIHMLEELMHKTGLTCHYVGNKETISEGSTSSAFSRVDSIENWLKAFRDAEYIVTDSFHGCVFAILFNKPFITLGNEGRGLRRFTSLFEKLGLQERLITKLEQANVLFTPIDYQRVNAILDIWREESLLYFKKYLN